jgi:ElaB/YqjD/DUF883 family membrane-anchored ribosome-binding protein
MNTNAENLAEEAQETVTNRMRVIADRAKACAQGTDEYVRENPWIAIGAAALLGTVIGLLIGRRNNS